MVTNEERERRYAAALGVQVHGMHPSEFDAIERVMALADAEQAELRAKVARVEALLAAWAEWVTHTNPPLDCVGDLARALNGDAPREDDHV